MKYTQTRYINETSLLSYAIERMSRLRQVESNYKKQVTIHHFKDVALYSTCFQENYRKTTDVVRPFEENERGAHSEKNARCGHTRE